MRSLIGMFVFFLLGAMGITWLAGGLDSNIWILRLLVYILWVMAISTFLCIVGDGLKHRRKKKANTRRTTFSDRDHDWKSNP